MKPSCLIVMYHYVGLYGEYSGVYAISGWRFADQVDALCEAMEPIDWPTLWAWTRGEASIPDRCFLLTFDDGLIQQERMVCPLLEKRGLRGTFLVPGAVLRGDTLLPAHAIHLLLSKASPASLEGYILGRYGREPNVADAEAMYHYEADPVTARVKYLLTVGLPRDERQAIIGELFAKYVFRATGETAEDVAARWYMNVTDLRRMQAAGHTIGGHGFSHEPYGNMAPSEQLDDMRRVHGVLIGALNESVPQPRPFSWPYGQPGAVLDANEFACAFTTERQWCDETCDPYLLPRVDAMYLEANNDAGFTVEPKAADVPVPAV